MGLPFGAHLVQVIAQVGDNGAPSLAQYGVLGAVLTVVVTSMGWVFRWALTGERARGDRLEKVVLDLNEYIRDRAVPALEAVAATNAEVARGNQEVTKVLAQVLRDREISARRRDD